MSRPYRVRLDQRIPMRDGVNLYGALYVPAEGERFPVLLTRTSYSTQRPDYVEYACCFATAGYAVLMVDCRGRFESEGKWRPYFCEVEDGIDTQRWIAEQPWCDGTIGMFGRSYVGFTQLLPAPFRCPQMKALMPIANQEDNYGHIRVDGVLQLQVSMNFVWIGDRTIQDVIGRGITHDGVVDMDEVYRRLPLISALDDIADRPFYREVIRHHRFDDFWKAYSMKGKYGEVETPAYFVTGWYDNLVHEEFKCFTGWVGHARSEEARVKSKLLVGPWPHAPMGTAEPFGDIDFGPSGALDLAGEHLRWFDQRLRGIDTGIDDEPPVRIFVMGDNVWRFEHEWPLARTEYTRWFLHSGGGGNTLDGDGRLDRSAPGDEPPDTYTYDPLDPVPSCGGQNLMSANLGPRDRQPVEGRSDILVYTSDVIERDMEVTGPITLTLYASSSARDTDFTGTLVDVHPDRRAINITEGILRVRYRDSLENPTLIDPGQIYELTITIWETSNVFKAGHRIRIEVSSSNFPRFDRNQNTGNEPGLDADVMVAEQTVHHDSQRPSHVTLPVIPR